MMIFAAGLEWEKVFRVLEHAMRYFAANLSIPFLEINVAIHFLDLVDAEQHFFVFVDSLSQVVDESVELL